MRLRTSHVPVLFFFLLFGCQAAGSAAAEVPSPARWKSPTASPSLVFPTREKSLTPTLAPTPTPRTYTVREGDTFGSIAAKFGITVDELMRANPDLNPNAIPIGQVLVIPAPSAGAETPQPSPTPAELGISAPACYDQPSGGRWCLVLVENPGPDSAVGVLFRFSLYPSAAADPSVSHEVGLPLTVLPAGERTVAAAFFAPQEARDAIVRVELISAVQTAETPEILPLTVQSENAEVFSDGVEVSVEFQVASPDGASAKRLDAVLALLDSAGRPVGFRILRSQGEWAAGPAHRLTLSAFVLGGRMETYELLIQARRE
jgi:LysM repeat protein